MPFDPTTNTFYINHPTDLVKILEMVAAAPTKSILTNYKGAAGSCYNSIMGARPAEKHRLYQSNPISGITRIICPGRNANIVLNIPQLVCTYMGGLYMRSDATNGWRGGIARGVFESTAQLLGPAQCPDLVGLAANIPDAVRAYLDPKPEPPAAAKFSMCSEVLEGLWPSAVAKILSKRGVS